MSAAAHKLSPPDPKRAVVEALAADLEDLKVPPLRAAVTACAVVYSSEGAFFRASMLIQNAPEAEPAPLIRLMQKHGLLPRTKARA